MHMSDALLSPAVGGTMLAVSAGMLAYSVYKSKPKLTDENIPMMGVTGAFVFAAQMINFTIPATGSSGHIGGGILLTALLGPQLAFLVLSAVLLIQAFFFADGGLLALGCNIFNMAFLTCYVAYPLLFAPFMKKLSKRSLLLASVVSTVAGLQLGAFFVVLETTASGVTALPFSSFLLLMQPIHLAIGLVEGLITAAVLTFIYEARPELIYGTFPAPAGTGKRSARPLVVGILVASVVIGGGLSLFASSFPDGLEWSMEKVAGQEEITGNTPLHQKAEALQEKTSILPDYSFPQHADSPAGTSVSGIAGGFATLAVCVLLGFLIKLARRKKSS